MSVLFEHPNSSRIYGPAGAGKTRALVEILGEHVGDGDFQLVEGIVVSFTRAASHDIAKRVNEGAPGRYHCTLHALCKRYYGFDQEFAEPKLKRFFGDRMIQFSGTISVDPDEGMANETQRSEGGLIYSFWNWCRNRLLTIAEGKQLWQPDPEIERWWQDDMLERLYADYQAWKSDSGLIDFTELLEYARENPPSGRHWAFFVLDEAQDCTPLQWAVAQAFARCAEVAYLAGDDDQAIYDWAGATPHEFLRARVGTEDTLHVNHRSGAVLVADAQEFIRRNKERHDKGMTAAREGGLIDREVPGSVPLPRLDESTMVMARAHYQNGAIIDELTRLGFPFVDRRGSAGVNGKASDVYRRLLRLGHGHAISVDELRLLFDAIPSDGPWLIRGAKKRLSDLGRPYRLQTYVRLHDIDDYGATEELVRAIAAHDISVLARIDQGRLGYLRQVEQQYGQEYLDERKAASVCQVGSIHSFKGLECDRAIIHLGMPARPARKAMQDPEPERRVLYVARTRAKERITYYQPGYEPTPWDRVL